MRHYTPHPRAAELDLLSRSIRDLIELLTPQPYRPSRGTECDARAALDTAEAWLAATPDDALPTAVAKGVRRLVSDYASDLRDLMREAGVPTTAELDLDEAVTEAEIAIIPLEARAPGAADLLYRRLERAKAAGDVDEIGEVARAARRRADIIRAHSEGALAVGGVA